MDTDDDQLANANLFGGDHKPTPGPLEAQARALLELPVLTDQRSLAERLKPHLSRAFGNDPDQRPRVVVRDGVARLRDPDLA